MTQGLGMQQTGRSSAHEVSSASRPSHQRFWPVVFAYFIVLSAVIFFKNMAGAVDYVGKDNDDVMRLVEVRDLLGGQGWFDLMQYRLGLDGGTLMHWSRLVDLPIASLIRFFGLFLPQESAEMVALAIWPLFLILPLLAAIALAGRRIGGHTAMHIALLMAALLVFTTNRFTPGSIDHHNLQLVLVAIIAAMLVDGSHRPSSYAVAAAAAAFAIAIGAETMPLIAATCLCVAVSWGGIGKPFAGAAKAFGLSLTLTISALFFLTVPPSSYFAVTCDSLSLGFYGLAVVGGMLLFLTAVFGSHLSPVSRFFMLAANAVAVAGTAAVLTPQCLASPLANLDPLLVTLWLDHVTEARNIFAEIHYEPELVGYFYAPGLLAIILCLCRIVRNEQRLQHGIFLTLIAVSWAVALVQVRGAIFANLLAIVPFSQLVSQLRLKSRQTQGAKFQLAYFGALLTSLPLTWVVAGGVYIWGIALLSGNNTASGAAAAAERELSVCRSKAAFQQLASLDPVLVATSVDSGASLLRFTGHRALSAPYHRNQGGMLAEIHIGISSPREAEAFMRGADVAILAFCPVEPGTRNLVAAAPAGLYAALSRGDVPPYLEALPTDPASGFRLFRLRPVTP